MSESASSAQPGAATPKLRVANVTKSFLSEDGTTVEVLKPINIDIAEGEKINEAAFKKLIRAAVDANLAFRSKRKS